MPLTINRQLFDRIKAAVIEGGRINMISWAENPDAGAVESVDEIRMLLLLGDCLTTSCIGGLACYLATQEEMAGATEIYDLSDNEVQEPSILSAALLLSGAEDKAELEAACLPLFSFIHWPLEEQDAYSASQSDAERNQIVVRRMENWAAEIGARQSAEYYP